MPYKAKEDIGNYKQGEVVSDEDAITWKEMYAVSPVEYFDVADEKIVSKDATSNSGDPINTVQNQESHKKTVSKGKVK